jgi:transposase InsO family protein
MILGLVDEAVQAGARQHTACEILNVDPRTVQRWARVGIGEDGRCGPQTPPRNKLTPKERAKVLAVANSKEFREFCPGQIVARLADRKQYLASEATIYRLLREENQLAHRGRSKPPSPRKKPEEHRATGPNQVWSWDISYLPTRVRGLYYYLYVVLDVWSRKIVGWDVHEVECGNLAAALFRETCEREGLDPSQLVVHADNGSPMKSMTLLTLFQVLGIAASFSRPSVSNDNPFVESFFHTAKYHSSYPNRAFQSLEDARAWAEGFVLHYNTQHLHSGIRYVTPDSRHRGEDIEILKQRTKTYQAAQKARPDRWTGSIRDWSQPEVVRLNPGSDATAAVA